MIDGCRNNPENSFTIKLEKHILAGFSMSTISSFKNREDKHNVYRRKDCMEKFCESLREHAIKIIIFKKQLFFENATICYIYKEKFGNKCFEDKKYHCHYTGEYRGAAHSICNLKYSVPKTIPIAFHSGSNYDYHFIIKELAE